MIVLGVVCLVAFTLWEKYLAPVKMLPWHFLHDRTILGGCLVYGFMFASIFCWDIYYYSYLQVVNGQGIAASGYMLNAYSLMSSFLSPFVGLLIRQTGQYKWPGASGIVFIAIGTGLLIQFRHPDTTVGSLVVGQILNGASGGIFAITSQFAVMAAVTHQEIAIVLALYDLFGSIGAAIGETIAGGIWTNVLPQDLENFLPDYAKNETKTIYGDITVQMSYPFDSPVRDAINAAYNDVMRKQVFAGAVFIIPLAVALFMWKNINVKKLEQERESQAKGNIFLSYCPNPMG